jgi:hypothetical protein
MPSSSSIGAADDESPVLATPVPDEHAVYGVSPLSLKQKASLSILAKRLAQRADLMPVSLFLFSTTNGMRRKAVAAATHPVFDALSLLVIVANCVLLALYDPLDGEGGNNRLLASLEPVFQFLFTVELLVKCLALGVWGKGQRTGGRVGYLADPWHWLDAGVIISGYAFIAPGVGSNSTSLRAFRMLRPLRVISAVPSMRTIVGTILVTLPALFNVMLLAGATLLVAGTVAVQLWAGLLRGRCAYADPDSLLGPGLAPLIPVPGTSCSLPCSGGGGGGGQGGGGGVGTSRGGMTECVDASAVSTCAPTWVRHNGTAFPVVSLLPTTCVESGNPGDGLVSFDDIGHAMLTIFTGITLEGWTDSMYATQAAWGLRWLVALFWIAIVAFGAYFLLQLVLAVVWESYQSRHMREEEELDAALLLHCPLLVEHLKGEWERRERREEALEEWREFFRHTADAARAECCCGRRGRGRGDWGRARRIAPASASGSDAASPPASSSEAGQGGRAADEASETAERYARHLARLRAARAREEAYVELAKCPPMVQLATLTMPEGAKVERTPAWPALARVMASPPVLSFVTSVIVINTVQLAMPYAGMSHDYSWGLEIANDVFSAVFGLEMLLRVAAEGPLMYFSDALNVFDFSVVVLSFVDIALSALSPGGASSGGGLAALRTFRLVRVFKLIRFWPDLRRLLVTIGKALVEVYAAIGVLAIILVTVTLFQLQLYGGRFGPAVASGLLPAVPRMNYDSFWTAFVSTYQTTTGENWNEQLEVGNAAFGGGYVALLVVIQFVGHYIFLNLFVAILLSAFESEMEAVRLEKIRQLHEQWNADALEKEKKHGLRGLAGERGTAVVELLEEDGGGGEHPPPSALPPPPPPPPPPSSMPESARLRSVLRVDSRASNQGEGGSIIGGFGPSSPASDTAKGEAASGPGVAGISVPSSSLKTAQVTMAELRAAPADGSSRRTVNGGEPTASTALVVDEGEQSPKPVPPPASPSSGPTPSAAPTLLASLVVEPPLGAAALAPQEPPPLSVQHAKTIQNLRVGGISRSKLAPPLIKAPSLGLSGAPLLPPGSPAGAVSITKKTSFRRYQSEGARMGWSDAAIAKAAQASRAAASANPSPTGSTRNLGVTRRTLGGSGGGGSNNSSFTLNNGSGGSGSVDGASLLPAPVGGGGSIGGGGGGIWGPKAAPTIGDKAEVSFDVKDTRARAVETTLEGGDGKRVAVRVLASGDVKVVRVDDDDDDDGTGSKRDVRRWWSATAAYKRLGVDYPESFGEEVPRADRSLFLFAPAHPVRKAAAVLASNPWFERVVLLLILISSINLALDEPKVEACRGLPASDPDSCADLAAWLRVSDIVLAALFMAEAAVKILALGLWAPGPAAYLRSSWNVLDFVIAVISVAAAAAENGAAGGGTSSSGLLAFRAFRALRALRPLRVISRYPGLKLIVNSIMSALPRAFTALVVNFLFLFVFAIVGLQNFGGALSSCNDPSVSDAGACTGTFQLVDGACALLPTDAEEAACRGSVAGVAFPRLWAPAPRNFDNIFRALLTVFEISTWESWPAIYYPVLDQGGPGHGPMPNSSPASALFFMAIQLVSGAFLMELFTGVIIANYYALKDEASGAGVLTEAQVRWVEQVKLILSVSASAAPRPPPPPARVRPSTPLGARLRARFRRLRQWCYGLVVSPRFDTVVMMAVVGNTGVLAARSFGQSDAASDGQEVALSLFSALFLAEAVLKLLALGPQQYFALRMNRFDFALVVFSILGWVVSFGPVALILRVIRIARIARLLRGTRGLLLLVRTLLISLPALVNVGAMLALLIYVAAIVSMILFSGVRRGAGPLSGDANFDSFLTAALTLFRCMTGEDFNGILHALEIQAPYCAPEDGPPGSGVVANCGDRVLPAIFFTVFVTLSTLILVKLLIAVIIDNFAEMLSLQDSAKAKAGAGLESMLGEGDGTTSFRLGPDGVEEFVTAWGTIDPHATRVTDGNGLVKLVQLLAPPMGVMGVKPGDVIVPGGDGATPRSGGQPQSPPPGSVRQSAFLLVGDLDLPLPRDGLFQFHVVLQALVKRASGGSGSGRMRLRPNERTLKESLSATRVQAAFRGKSARKRVVVLLNEVRAKGAVVRSLGGGSAAASSAAPASALVVAIPVSPSSDGGASPSTDGGGGALLASTSGAETASPTSPTSPDASAGAPRGLRESSAVGGGRRESTGGRRRSSIVTGAIAAASAVAHAAAAVQATAAAAVHAVGNELEALENRRHHRWGQRDRERAEKDHDLYGQWAAGGAGGAGARPTADPESAESAPAQET